MRELAILTFLTIDGVMQAPSSPEEDPSDGFTHGGWARDCWDEVMEQVRREASANGLWSDVRMLLAFSIVETSPGEWVYV